MFNIDVYKYLFLLVKYLRIKKALFYYFILKWSFGFYSYGLKYSLIFFENLHNGTHKHAGFWRYFCPVAMSNDAGSAVTVITDSGGFKLITALIFMWLLNEIACQDRLQLIRLFTPNNIIMAANFFNPFKYAVLFHFNGNPKASDTFLYFSRTQSLYEIVEEKYKNSRSN